MKFAASPAAASEPATTLPAELTAESLSSEPLRPELLRSEPFVPPATLPLSAAGTVIAADTVPETNIAERLMAATLAAWGAGLLVLRPCGC